MRIGMLIAIHNVKAVNRTLSAFMIHTHINVVA